MATSDAVKSIDSLSKSDRDLVVVALELRIASLRRGSKASTIPGVAQAMAAELANCEALLLRFR